MVDIVIGLMVPANLDESHYADIRLITGILGDDALRQRLRAANTSNDLYQALISSPTSADENLKSALNA